MRGILRGAGSRLAVQPIVVSFPVDLFRPLFNSPMIIPLTTHLHPPACRSARHDGWIVAVRFTDQGDLRSTIRVSITIWCERPSDPFLNLPEKTSGLKFTLTFFTRCTHKAKAIKGLLIETNPHRIAKVSSDWG